jgi:hypothetical protein
MDIYCPRCAEPCDVDELHYAEPMTYSQARKVYFDRSQGCGVVFNGRPCELVDDIRAELSAMLAGELGDDIDGIAGMMDDFGDLLE